MVKFSYPDGADQFDAAAFTQNGEFLKAGHFEECELVALEAHGLYCYWVKNKPVIRFDFVMEA